MRNQSCHLEPQRGERSKRFTALRFFAALRMTVILFLVLPTTVLAAEAGFVPSSGVWFSTNTIVPGQLIRVYTVVINNSYFALDGTVGFYDNDVLIDTTQFKALEKETAAQLKVLWQPTIGDHVVKAVFQSATAIDSSGKRTIIPVSELTGVAAAVVSSSSSAPALITEPVQPDVSIAVVSSSDNKNLVIISSPSSGGQGAVGEVVKTGGSIFDSLRNLFASNHEALNKAESAVATITSTANKVQGAYNTAQTAVQKSEIYYNQTKAVVGKFQTAVESVDPYFAPIRNYWLKLTNNNEPTRILIVVGVIVAIIILWKLSSRRIGQDYDR